MSTPLRQRQNPDVPWVGYPIGPNRRILIADSANSKKVKWDWLQVGGSAANRIQLHDHADVGDPESDDGFIHFLSPEPEQQYHGNLFQETIGTSGARQAQVSLYPSQWNLRESSHIKLRSESVNGASKPYVNISAGTSGRIDLVAGSAVTGPLGYDPTDANHLTRKAWVDAQISTVTGNANNRVLRAGDSMTGALFAPEFRTGRDTYQKIRIEDTGTHAAIRFDSPDSNEGVTGYLLQEMSGTFQHVLSLSPSKYNLGSVPYVALWSSTVDNATKGKVVLEAAGGTVTIGAGGPIEGPGFDPTLANHLADKEWVDGQVATVNTNANSRVLRSGDTMTGRLIGPSLDPAFADEYTRQTYVMGLHNQNVRLAGSTMTGMLTLPNSDPTVANHAVRKQYVDNLVAGYGYVLKTGDVMTGRLQIDAEDQYLSVDAASLRRLGFMKKSGASPVLAHASVDFTIAYSSIANDIAATGVATLTPQLVIRPDGAVGVKRGYNGVGVGAWSNRGLSSGLQFGYDATNNISKIGSISEDVAWRDMEYFANDHRWYRASTRQMSLNVNGLLIGSSGLEDPGTVRIDPATDRIIFKANQNGLLGMDAVGNFRYLVGLRNDVTSNTTDPVLYSYSGPWRIYAPGVSPVIQVEGNMTMTGNYFYGASGFRMGEIYGHRGLYTESTNMRFDVGLLNGEFQFSYQGSIKSTMSKTGDWWANAFTVGIAGEQRIEMHRHDGASFIHFYAPGESWHGNLYQDSVGVAGTTRQHRIWFYTSTPTNGWESRIRLDSGSDDNTVKGEISLNAGPGGRILVSNEMVNNVGWYRTTGDKGLYNDTHAQGWQFLTGNVIANQTAGSSAQLKWFKNAALDWSTMGIMVEGNHPGIALHRPGAYAHRFVARDTDAWLQMVDNAGGWSVLEVDVIDRSTKASKTEVRAFTVEDGLAKLNQLKPAKFRRLPADPQQKTVWDEELRKTREKTPRRKIYTHKGQQLAESDPEVVQFKKMSKAQRDAMDPADRIYEDIDPSDHRWDGLTEAQITGMEAERDKVTMGLMAEDVAQIYPEAVAFDMRGKPSGIRYRLLTIPLIQGVQQLDQRIVQLEAEVMALRQKVGI